MPSLMRLACALALALAGAQAVWAAGGYAVYESSAAFEDIMEGLKSAIGERGMYINNVMHMDEMLERTGKDLRLGEPIYAKAESIEFCSAALSHKMTAEDPARIVNCPFIVSAYVLAKEPGKTYVAHREIPSDQVAASPVMAEVAANLKAIAEAAVAW
jgi:uncharacterized protein (DUF302 family)